MGSGFLTYWIGPNRFWCYMNNEYPKYEQPGEDLPSGVRVFNRDGTLNVSATEALQKLVDENQNFFKPDSPETGHCIK
jgi:hypothetical protein